MGKHEKQKRVEIVKGVKQGRKGKVVKTTNDEYGEHYMIRSDEGTIITPINSENTRDI